MKYTDFQLRQAFELVEDRAHWKNPIDATIKAEDRDVVEHAIIYFTASKPTFTLLDNGNYRVQAAGYWASGC